MKKIFMLATILTLTTACTSKEEAAPAADSTAVDTLVVEDSTSVIMVDSSAIYQK